MGIYKLSSAFGLWWLLKFMSGWRILAWWTKLPASAKPNRLATRREAWEMELIPPTTPGLQGLLWVGLSADQDWLLRMLVFTERFAIPLFPRRYKILFWKVQIHRTHITNLILTVHTCNSSAVGREKQTLGVFWPASQTFIVSFRFSERSESNRGRQRAFMCMSVHVWVQTWTYNIHAHWTNKK